VTGTSAGRPGLAGATVIVTRPARQASHFIGILERAGATTVAFPGIEIIPIELAAADLTRLCPDAFDWAIYTSANAVEESLKVWPRQTARRSAAIGRATARLLESRGIAACQPDAGQSQDSEGLLQRTEFRTVRNQRILLLRGQGGREVLHEELTRLGATVEIAELYRRAPARADVGAIADLAMALQAPHKPWVTVTSVAVLDGLLGSVPGEFAGLLRESPLVVPGERVGTAAKERGWRGRLILAASAEDGAMFDAMVRAASASLDEDA
jgi:uroporphyrinogen-III synthase